MSARRRRVAERNLEARRAAYDALRVEVKRGRNRPGSLNARKTGGPSLRGKR